jgi:hypothetical protein
MVDLTDKAPSETAINEAKALISLQKGKNYASGQAAKALFEWIANEGIDEGETLEEDISEQIEDDEDFEDIRWIDLLKLLGDKGLGRFLVGRHGHKTRFAWQGGSSLDIACRVLGHPRVQPRNGPSRSVTTAQNPANHKSTTLKVGRIEVRLPPDVTSDELTDMINWLEVAKNVRA